MSQREWSAAQPHIEREAELEIKFSNEILDRKTWTIIILILSKQKRVENSEQERYNNYCTLEKMYVNTA